MIQFLKQRIFVSNLVIKTHIYCRTSKSMNSEKKNTNYNNRFIFNKLKSVRNIELKFIINRKKIKIFQIM